MEIEKVKCQVCKEMGVDTYHHFLGDHLKVSHGLSLNEYLERFPDAICISNKVWRAFQKKANDLEIVRKGSDHFANRIKIGNITLTRREGEVWYTFERPDSYEYPKSGKAGHAIERLARALKYGRDTFVYGPAGAGKSAAIRALCHDLNMEASHYPMRDGLDTELYIGKEAVVIDEETGLNVTRFIKGKLLKDLEGRVGKDGVRRGVVILIDDFDRAPAEYAEVFRHILEDNARNIFVPELGVNINVHPETIIIATANSAGRGDMMGYYTSVQEADESILDRFQRVIEFHFLDPEQEAEILKKKYPNVSSANADAITTVMKVANDIRAMIANNEIFVSFSHRRLTQWLDSLDELLQENGNVFKQSMLRESANDWLEWYDHTTRVSVINRVVDLHCGS